MIFASRPQGAICVKDSYGFTTGIDIIKIGGSQSSGIGIEDRFSQESPFLGYSLENRQTGITTIDEFGHVVPIGMIDVQNYQRGNCGSGFGPSDLPRSGAGVVSGLISEKFFIHLTNNAGRIDVGYGYLDSIPFLIKIYYRGELVSDHDSLNNTIVSGIGVISFGFYPVDGDTQLEIVITFISDGNLVQNLPTFSVSCPYTPFINIITDRHEFITRTWNYNTNTGFIQVIPDSNVIGNDATRPAIAIEQSISSGSGVAIIRRLAYVFTLTQTGEVVARFISDDVSDYWADADFVNYDVGSPCPFQLTSPTHFGTIFRKQSALGESDLSLGILVPGTYTVQFMIYGDTRRIPCCRALQTYMNRDTSVILTQYPPF